ncbi:unnamed protein product, partial [Gongylonema pulchrum]|uniref:G domain-containing protein n=1 Tax=Gongylonema pulchrum TaxID=637853 RepID=A0A183E0A5_9BILA
YFRKPIEKYYSDIGITNFVWTNCKKRLREPLIDLQNMMLKCLREEPRFNRYVMVVGIPNVGKSSLINSLRLANLGNRQKAVMVVGIPNVGKSSLINSLRLANLGNRQKAVQEGARPGVTTRVQTRVRILDQPPVYIKVLLDICQSNDIRFPTYIAQRRAERWDIDRAAKMFIEMFRNNKLRDHCLDIDLFQNYITKII